MNLNFISKYIIKCEIIKYLLKILYLIMPIKIIFTEKQIHDIKYDYIVNNLTTKEISVKHDVSLYTILRLLKKENVKIKTPTECHKKYNIDNHYFDKIDTEDKAYYLGLLFSDGYNNTKNGTVSLTLQKKDIEILNRFNIMLCSNKPLRNDRDYLRLVIENKHMSSKLNLFGCVQAKTHVLKFPKIKSKYLNHFIRGYFDGDGCITWSKNKLIPQFSITGNQEFLVELQKKLIDKLKLKKTKFIKRHKERNDNITTLVYGSYGNCIKIYHYLYDNSNFFFERKRNKFIEIFNILNVQYE